MKREIDLKRLEKLNFNHVKDLRKLRNQKSIAYWMYDSRYISAEKHILWYKNTIKDKTKITYVIFENNEPIGTFYLVEIDKVNKTCKWGWYIGEQYAGSGLGSIIEYYCVNYIFNNLKFEKQTVEVLEGNEKVIGLHKKFFFIEEGFKREHILKENKRIGSFVLSLIKEEWKMKKIKLKDRILFDNYLIKIDGKKQKK